MVIKSRFTWPLQTFLGLFLGTTITALGVKLYRLHDHAHIRYDPQLEILWLAPLAAHAERESTIISNRRWRQNYSEIERVLWEVQNLGDNSNASLSNVSLKHLERINGLLRENLSSDELVRLRSLVEKSIVSDKAPTFANWIVNYYRYQKTDQQLKSTINLAHDDHRITLIKNYLINLDARQKKHFGNHALFLFEQQNHQTHYFYRRRLVRLDNSLTAQQQAIALEAIKQEYKTQFESYRHD